MQVENRSNDPFAVDYRTGVKNVWQNLSTPLQAIRTYGGKTFVQNEIVPFTLNQEDANYWPNYTQHLIGGGMSYRLMAEWYEHHRYPKPRLWALATTAIYHGLNEVVENDGYRGVNVDPIADMCIFNPLSILLFQSDRVCRFFSQTLNFADWSYQLGYDPWSRTLQNNGQNFSLKYRLPFAPSWSLFYFYGTHGEFGLSYRRKNGEALSAGFGLTARELVDLEAPEGSRRLTADLALTAGIFYDRHNSLLFSCIYSDRKDNMLRINVYPGLVRLGAYSPGFFLLLDRDNRLIMGMNLLLPVAVCSYL